MRFLCPGTTFPIASLWGSDLIQHRPNPAGCALLDMLVLVLGTGGILLMGAYAVFCDRI